MFESELDATFRAYLVCAIWTGHDIVDGEDVDLDDYEIDDIADETRASLFSDLCEFLNMASDADLAMIDWEQVGHDFCLTRNHHGAGFWDRGIGDAGTRLTDLAQSFGESNLYIGDDSQLHAE